MTRVGLNSSFPGRVPSDEAVIDYQEIDANTWDMFHTYTPPAHRGKGLAEKVTTAAIDTAIAQGKKVVPSCKFSCLIFLLRTLTF